MKKFILFFTLFLFLTLAPKTWTQTQAPIVIDDDKQPPALVVSYNSGSRDFIVINKSQTVQKIQIIFYDLLGNKVQIEEMQSIEPEKAITVKFPKNGKLSGLYFVLILDEYNHHLITKKIATR